MDFDVLQDYAVYPHDTTDAFIAEYLPTSTAYGAFATLEEALETILNKVNDKKKLESTLQEAGAKFQEVV
jgi:predicted mannosyl-3-phosphoglycerate phosphatase (HAD superfamily)